MDEKFDELCDNLDAAVFTGDWLADAGNRAGLNDYLERWAKELKIWGEQED